jgi:hypothetical protein
MSPLLEMARAGMLTRELLTVPKRDHTVKKNAEI